MVISKRIPLSLMVIVSTAFAYFTWRLWPEIGRWNHWLKEQAQPDLIWMWREEPLIVFVLVLAITLLFLYLVGYYGHELYVWYRLKQYGVLGNAVVVAIQDSRNRLGWTVARRVSYEFHIPGLREPVQGADNIPFALINKYARGSTLSIRYDSERPRLSRIEEHSFVNWGFHIGG